MSKIYKLEEKYGPFHKKPDEVKKLFSDLRSIVKLPEDEEEDEFYNKKALLAYCLEPLL